MRATRCLAQGIAAMGAVVLLIAYPLELESQQRAMPRIDADDIGGVVRSANGPEAGVWVIAETTDLPSKYAKIVVTDDRGSYVIPDLPKANYSVWVRGNMIGMFDTKTERTREWAVTIPWTNPYDAVLDKDGYAWTGGMTNDTIVRLNTKTEEFTGYLLPRTTNVQRVNVDNSTSPPTFWVGNNNGAAIIKIEPLE